MSCRFWCEMWNVWIRVCFSVKAYILHLCVHFFCLYRSVSAGCAATAQRFMSRHSAPGCLFWQFSAAAPCSRPLLDPALAFLLHSFCPTVDEDIAIGCLSSLWQWSALMDIPELEDTPMVGGLMLYIQSLHGTCWSCFCCRQAAPSGNLTSPFLSVPLFVR